MKISGIPYKLIAIAFIFLAVMAFIWLRGADSTPIEAKPTRDDPRDNAVFMLPDNYSFRQDNPQWGESLIGSTDDTMQAYGCTIASVAMAASNLGGRPISPLELQTKMNDQDGFTDRGWFIWGKLPAATNGAFKAAVFSEPNHADIQQCMYDGHYPVLKIKLFDSIIHWVMVVGQTKDDYLIRDPLVGKPFDPPIRLSSRSEKIYSVRCISNVE